MTLHLTQLAAFLCFSLFWVLDASESEERIFSCLTGASRQCTHAIAGFLLILEATQGQLFTHSDGIPLRAMRTEGSSVFGGARRREKCIHTASHRVHVARGPKTGQRARRSLLSVRCNRNRAAARTHTCCSLNASLAMR